MDCSRRSRHLVPFHQGPAPNVALLLTSASPSALLEQAEDGLLIYVAGYSILSASAAYRWGQLSHPRSVYYERAILDLH
jgi:hypothetical protein